MSWLLYPHYTHWTGRWVAPSQSGFTENDTVMIQYILYFDLVFPLSHFVQLYDFTPPNEVIGFFN
jgi:hypothetical protein